MRFENDGVGASSKGNRHGHGGIDAVLACLVRCRSDHGTGAAAADDDGFADEVGPFEKLDGCEEGVHVDVHNRRGSVVDRLGRNLAATTILFAHGTSFAASSDDRPSRAGRKFRWQDGSHG